MELENQTQQPVQTTQPPAQVADDVVMRDRTREQFEKLKESNDRLFEQNSALQKQLNDLSGIITQAKAPQQPQQQQSEWDFYQVNEKTGETYLDRDKFGKTLKELQERTQNAETTVQKYIKSNEEKELMRQNEEAFNAYPELNPQNQDKFDKKFHLQVQGLLYSSLISPEQFNNRPLTFKEAADMVSGGPRPSKTVSDEPKGPTEQQVAKDAATAQVSSLPQNQSSYVDDEDLRRLRVASRGSDDRAMQALIERMNHTEHILPYNSSVK